MIDVDYEKAAEYLARAGLNDVQVSSLIDAGYMTAPASSRYHLNTDGGLVTHSMNVVDNILKLTPVLGVEWELERSPYLIGMLHDMVKCHCYARTGTGWRYADHEHGSVPHGVASLRYAIKDALLEPTAYATCSDDVQPPLTRQEELCILHHMGAYGLDADGMRHFNDAKREMPREILCTHWADDMAASIDEVWQ